MAETEKIKSRIEELTQTIESSPLDASVFLERAKLYFKMTEHSNALNDFNRVLELEPKNVEAAQSKMMIESIFEFRYVDYYNP